jgi:hypothetical protein
VNLSAAELARLCCDAENVVADFERANLTRGWIDRELPIENAAIAAFFRWPSSRVLSL